MCKLAYFTGKTLHVLGKMWYKTKKKKNKKRQIQM